MTEIILINSNGERIYPKFATPLVEQLNSNNESVYVSIQYENEQLIVQRDDKSKILFRRPSYCPFTNLFFQNQSSQIPENPSNRIALGVVILFESHDHRVLLTRRAAHMRTFPSCWVCPGGGIEKNETLLQAGIRELQEEVGIEVQENELETAETLALWESSFPVELSHGLPRRHHIVIYLHIRSSRTSDEITVQIDPKEVDAYAWLSFNQIGYICKQLDLTDSSSLFNAHVHPTGMCDLPFHSLTSANHSEKENLTNGTRFALERLYLLNSSINID